MKPVDTLTHRVTSRIIVIAAMMVLALSSTSTRRVGPVMATTAATGVVAAAAATPENSESAQSSTPAAVPSAKEVRGASPYIEIKNEPAPRLIVDPPLPDLLDRGVVWIQWRAENVHIVPNAAPGPHSH